MLFPNDEELDQLVLGPDSVAWRVTSDMRLNFAMLYPLLLQVAHPTVDAGVSDHSEFEQRPWERVLRTIDYLNVMVYGGSDAIAAGRHLRERHQRFRGVREDGRRYSALEPEAYAWVHATLLDTFVRANARFGTPMRPAEVDRFYREYRGLGRLIGVRERDLPPTWPRFCSYFRRTARDQLKRTASVERVLDAIRNLQVPPPRPMPDPLWRAIRIPTRRGLWVGGIGLMEPGLRRQLKIGWNPLDEAHFQALSIVSRGLGPAMPASMKVTGPDHLRWRREVVAG